MGSDVLESILLIGAELGFNPRRARALSVMSLSANAPGACPSLQQMGGAGMSGLSFLLPGFSILLFPIHFGGL